MNLCFIIGNLTKKPEKVQGPEKTLTRMCVAMSSNYTTADGERPTQYFNVCAWGVLAENCIKYLDKGSKIAVLGKLQYRAWEDKDGNKKNITEIVATEIEFISTPRKEKEVQMEEIKEKDWPF